MRLKLMSCNIWDDIISNAKERDVENILSTFYEERNKTQNRSDFQSTFKHNVGNIFKSIRAPFVIIICERLYHERIIIVLIKMDFANYNSFLTAIFKFKKISMMLQHEIVSQKDLKLYEKLIQSERLSRNSEGTSGNEWLVLSGKNPKHLKSRECFNCFVLLMTKDIFAKSLHMFGIFTCFFIIILRAKFWILSADIL